MSGSVGGRSEGALDCAVSLGESGLHRSMQYMSGSVCDSTSLHAIGLEVFKLLEATQQLSRRWCRIVSSRAHDRGRETGSSRAVRHEAVREILVEAVLYRLSRLDEMPKVSVVGDDDARLAKPCDRRRQFARDASASCSFSTSMICASVDRGRFVCPSLEGTGTNFA